jgi:Ca2+-binding RTX toxin-like protein
MTAEDTPLTLSLSGLLANDTDVDSTLTGASIVSVGNAVGGTVSLSGSDVIFTPAADYFGAASFTYTLSDGALSDSGLVAVTVTAVNDAPVITNLVLTETSISFIATDVDGDALVLGGGFAAAFGNPTINNGSATTLTVAEQAAAISGTLEVTDAIAAVGVIDLFLGTSSADTVDLSSAIAAVALYGFGGADTLTGGSAADYLFGGSGGDALAGNGASDVYGVDSLSDSITEGSGGGEDTVWSSITLSLGGHVENLLLTGTSNINGTGNALINKITGNSASNTLYGGDQNDTIDLGGNSTVNWDYAYGGPGDDTITGGTGWVQISGEAGNDTIDVSGAGVNTGKYTYVQGGADNDTITGSLGIDYLYGDGGNDTINAGDGNDIINGGAGTDTIDAGAGNDTITSGNGEGPDGIDGGADSDTLSLNRSSSAAVNIVDFSSPAVLQTLGDGTTVVNVEQITFSSGTGGDTITSSNHSGGASSNSVSGGGGDDTLIAAASGATLYGDAGLDHLTGSGVNDNLYGGDQNDTIDLGGNSTVYWDYAYGGAGDDTITGGTGWVQVSGEAGNDTIDVSGAGANTGKYTYVQGGADNDTITGSLGIDYLYGDGGNDTINAGSGGSDVINGGDGSDSLILDRSTATAALTFNMVSVGATTTLVGNGTTVINVENLRLVGGSGNDSFKTLAGDDTLDGMAGADTLEGGGGVDRFVLHAALGSDTIVDFVAGTDLLRFSTAELNIASGDLASRLLNLTATASGANAGAELLFDNTTSTLRYDADGVAGGEVVIAILTGITSSLTAANFDVVA